MQTLRAILHNRVRAITVPVLALLLAVRPSTAHERETDPHLAELNDYVMALQVMRHGDPAADSLFRRWQQLREASWEIRTLTDEQDLTIDDPAVRQQISRTRELRESLLKECHAFFDRRSDELPTAEVHLEDEIEITWNNPIVSAPVGSRNVVILKMTSERPTHSHLYLDGSESEEVLFWSKPVAVSPDHPRYTFAYIAPADAGRASGTITVRADDTASRTLTIRGDGTLPATYAWYNHVPAATIFDMTHGDTPRIAHTIAGAAERFSSSIRFRIRSPESGAPMPVRVQVKDSTGRAYWSPLRGPGLAVNRESTGWETPLWSFQPGPFFYIGGDAALGVDPADKTVRISHGFEYEPVVMEVPADGIVDAAPRRWIDMAERGWYSGHTHIHTTDAGLPVQYNRFWPVVTRAEDLGLSAILTLQGERQDHLVYADEYTMGPLERHSTDRHLITYGEEYRNNPFGHLALLNLDYLIQPVSSGALGELGGPDYPPNQFVLEEALSQGATTIGAHFGHYISRGEPIGASWPSTGFEMPTNVALGAMHLAEIYGNGGQLDIWYRLLNCGFDIPATAGPDWVMKDTPRAYVYLGNDDLTVDRWLEGLKTGRSFITRGPMLFFAVDGQKPGGNLNYANRPQTVSVDASALTPDGRQPVEIVVNGEVVASGTDLSREITLDDSAWIAARTRGAHTNPVYVTLEGRKRGFAEEARQFIGITERLEEWVRTRALFDRSAQQETVLQVLAEGRAVYESIIERAERLDRESPYVTE